MLRDTGPGVLVVFLADVIILYIYLSLQNCFMHFLNSLSIFVTKYTKVLAIFSWRKGYCILTYIQCGIVMTFSTEGVKSLLRVHVYRYIYLHRYSHP